VVAPVVAPVARVVAPVVARVVAPVVAPVVPAPVVAASVRPAQPAASQPAPLQPLDEAAVDMSDVESPEEIAADKAYGLVEPPPAPRSIRPVAVRRQRVPVPQAPVPMKDMLLPAAHTLPKTAVARLEASAAPVKPALRLKVVQDARKAVREAARVVGKAAAHSVRKAAATKAAAQRSRKRAASLPTPPTQDSSAVEAPSGGSDFDALEAQLHEEDRRIQDLDRENTLDERDGLMPAAPAASKMQAANPRLELDAAAEAPMEDFLNVEGPSGPESEGAEAALLAPDAPMALPQVGGLTDNQFLAQFAAPTARHG